MLAGKLCCIDGRLAEMIEVELFVLCLLGLGIFLGILAVAEEIEKIRKMVLERK